MDIIKRFKELTNFTYILGQEHELEHLLPKDIQKDKDGNYFLKIGESKSMFAAHLDTAAGEKKPVKHIMLKHKKTKDIYVATDKTTLLGADDKAGVIILLNMIENKVPGLYYFFIGEESGCVGSNALRSSGFELLEKYDRCISFDRCGYDSIISEQMGEVCCSKDFVDSLSLEFAKNGMDFQDDPTGVYTDSANFIDVIPECTNISVGYFHEHTVNEYQNVTFLEKLAEAACKVKWDELPTKRDPSDAYSNHSSNSFSGGDDTYSTFYNLDILIETYLDVYCRNFNDFEEGETMVYSSENEDYMFNVVVEPDGAMLLGERYYFDIDEVYNTISEYHTLEINELRNILLKKTKKINPDSDMMDSVNIGEFSNVVLEKAFHCNRNFLYAHEMAVILKLYNQPIESLVKWLYKNGNNPQYTSGITWDEKNEHFNIYE